MTRHDDHLYLFDMLEAARKCRDYTTDIEVEAFLRDELLQLAVARLLSIVGEAARKVSPATREQLPEIPWKQVTGMRHVIIHEYFRIDLDMLWVTARQELAPLIASLDAYMSTRLPSEPGDGE